MSATDDIQNLPAELDPTRWFSPPPGTDGHLVERETMRAWLREVTDRHGHTGMRTFGTSTEGRPLDAIFVGSELARRGLGDIIAERELQVRQLLSGTDSTTPSHPIVLITSGIHATEVGGPQSLPRLIWWLLNAPEAAAVRDSLLTIIVPTLNPDGFDLVTRWHRQTLDTDHRGNNPPLLYHRFAGHDNNRDWLYRNLAETRATLDAILKPWLPHVTLDQHQMSRHGPRFALPPYADPWEPHIHPIIIAASNALGQAIASDMTLAGMRGVMTGRYFDVWEPSRALQHYRGGIRILAEAASAALAHPIQVTADELSANPLPQPLIPGADCPLPWPGGRWGLRDITEYHFRAASSLLTRVAAEPDRWIAVQQESLTDRRTESTRYFVPTGHEAIDHAANARLTSLLKATGATADASDEPTFEAAQPLGRLLDTLLLPGPYPAEHGQTAYDITTHHLPLIMGATIRTTPSRNNEPPPDLSKQFLLVDARSHAAPEALEPVLRYLEPAAWRASVRSITDGRLIGPGTWVIDRSRHPSPNDVEAIASASIDLIPGDATPVTRRDLVLLDVVDEQSEDHGWTRWWLHARSIPFLEAGILNGPDLEREARSTAFIIADTSRASASDASIRRIGELVAAGATAIAFGTSGRLLAESLAPGVRMKDLSRHGAFKAPGALVRLQLEPGTAIVQGLDRWIPAMFQRDGAFSVSRAAGGTEVLARFARRDTLVSGWMASVEPLGDAPAVLRICHGAGALYAFAFRPLFRAQTLATAPLVHNLLYTSEEHEPCPPSDREKQPAGNTSGRTS